MRDPEADGTLTRLCQAAGCYIVAASSCEEVLARVRNDDIDVLICEDRFGSSTWQHILATLKDLPASPPFVVTSRLADDRLWAEVLNMGGFDVLAQPFRFEEVSHVVLSACRHRHPVSKRGTRVNGTIASAAG